MSQRSLRLLLVVVVVGVLVVLLLYGLFLATFNLWGPGGPVPPTLPN